MYLEILNRASLIYLSFAFVVMFYYLLRNIFYRTKAFASIITYVSYKLIAYMGSRTSENEYEE